jgi:Fic family protein
MPDWDEDSPRLRQNLKKLLRDIRDQALARAPLRLANAKTWHRMMMSGLKSPGKNWAGCFRGAGPISAIEVVVGSYPGTPAAEVATETAQFEAILRRVIQHLDTKIPPRSTPTPDQLSAVIEACAWVHAEWVRIHPFANGNGRTARLWANAIAMRYGLPPFIRLRPRPNFGYEDASGQSMLGNREPTTQAFHRMLAAFLQTP